MFLWKNSGGLHSFMSFSKICLTNNYISRDPHYVILAWVQSWNISENLMKVCSSPEFFHKNMSHEQLAYIWSTFRDSSMGTKFEIFLKNSWSVHSAWNFSQKHVSRTITFHMIHISWFQHACKVKIFLKSSWNCDVRMNFFTKSCLTNNYLSCDPHSWF